MIESLFMKHDTAIIDEGAVIGSETKIWHFTHVCGGARIGNKCSLGQNVFIGNNVLVGNNVKIQNNVSVYDNVLIEDDVFCGPSMVFTNVMNPRSEITRKSEYLRTEVKKGVTIGANATIVCGVVLEEYCFIGAGTVITKDTRRFGLYVGNPGKQIGWMSRFGLRIPLPLKGNGEYICPNLNEKYILKGESLEVENLK